MKTGTLARRPSGTAFGPRGADAVQRKGVFGEIDSKLQNRQRLPLPGRSMKVRTFPRGTAVLCRSVLRA